MSQEITRYELDWYIDEESGERYEFMSPSQHGDYILFDDYKRLEERFDIYSSLLR